MANNFEVWLYSSDPANIPNLEVTSYVQSINTFRGKSRALDAFQPGSMSITFNNQNRVFDPTNTSSPLYGYVAPNRRIYVSQDSLYIFSGLISDWTFTYNVNGESVASISVAELTSLFSNQYFTSAKSFPSELSGARLNRVLDDTDVQWPNTWGSRDLDAGTRLLDAQTVAAGTNVGDYLNQLVFSEQGALYNAPAWGLKFDDNSMTLDSAGVLHETLNIPLFTDDNSTYLSNGSAVPGFKYDFIDVSYTTQLLYNRIIINAYNGASSTANYTSSQADYGLYQFDSDDVLYSDVVQLGNLATFVGSKYSEPEYRIDSLRVNFYALSDAEQYRFIEDVRLNRFGRVRFKPNNTGSTIERYVKIIGINREATAGDSYVTLLFESFKSPILVLDDAAFGILDTNVLAL